MESHSEIGASRRDANPCGSLTIEHHGYCILPTKITVGILNTLRETLFHDNSAGERCLLDHPTVRETALALKYELISTGQLTANAVAIQAIAFNKTAATNWKVAWHQDLMFPFARRVTTARFDLPTLKQGVHYARPPESVLKQLLAVRLHLDDCDATNGPLRISPGTHLTGIIQTSEIPNRIANHGETTCFANQGEVLLMRPLTLHASSQATEPKHRRILHLVYHSGEPIPEPWHRAI
jgi:ectoine hydroxylase-related dioxygenase (phytanoyl-CoA dioxygenase family)